MKPNVTYKFGSEYASGGAGGISTVDDYIKFLEALRVGDIILKKESILLMATNQLSEYQSRTYTSSNTHGYGLGVRCPHKDVRYSDFGWAGAASAFCAVDCKNEISLYFGTHMFWSPVHELITMLYRFARAELIDDTEFDGVYRDLEQLHNYNKIKGEM